MNIPLECPFAAYGEKMRIICRKNNSFCGNVYFKRCKGWWVQNDAAKLCPLRRTAESDRVQNRQIR